MNRTAQYTKYTSSGYTLIEILIGLTIIGFLFSFGYASFRDFSRRESLNGVINQLQGDLRLTQSLASSGEKPSNPSCDSPNLLDGYQFHIISSTEYRIEAKCTGSNIVTKDVTLPTEITISANPSPNPIVFKVLGQGTNIANGSSATIVLLQQGTNQTITITITSGGEIK